MGAGIKPGKAAAHHLYIEAVALQVDLVDVSDLQFSACGGCDPLGDLNYIVIVKVESGNGVFAFRLVGFLFQVFGFALFVERILRHSALDL